MSTQGEQAIITGIETDAESEINRILSEAQVYVEQKKKSLQSQLSVIVEKGRAEAEAAALLLQKTEKSALAVEKRRATLALREKTCAHIVKRIEENLETLPREKERYGKLLLDLTTEALSGLDADEAVIFVSRIDKDFMDETLVRTATERANALTGRKISAQLSPQFEGKQGVFVRTKDGRMGFNNQIQTRLRRMEDRIRERIQMSLFADGETEL